MGARPSSFKRNLLATSIASCVLLSTDVLSQNAEITEEVIVRGIRSALEQSIDLKRDSSQIVEAITADDIGKMPDQNVAESLQRLPGVQVDRRDGEGTKVRIRGLDQNITLLNGGNFVSGLEYFQLGESQEAFDGSLEGVPSELLGGLEVYKTPVASMIEGGMGGVVNLKTRNALLLREPLAAASVKADYGLDARDVQPSGFVVLGNNWGDKFAALVSLSVNSKTVHTDSVQNFSRENTQVRCTGGGAFNEESLGCESETGAALGQSYIAPGMFYVSDRETERDRVGGSVNLQWAATDALEFGFDWFHSRLDYRSRAYAVKHAMSTDDAAGIMEDRAYVIDSSRAVGVLQSASVLVPGAETNSAGEVMEGAADNIVVKAALDNGGSWRFSGSLTGSTSEFEQRAGFADSRFTPYTFRGFVGTGDDGTGTGWGNVTPNPGGGDRIYEYGTGEQPYLRWTNEAWLTNPDFHTFKSHWALGSDVEQDAAALRLDAEFDIGLSHLRTLKFGLRQAENDVEFTQLRWLTDFSQTDGAMSPNIFDNDGSISAPTNFDPTVAPGATAVNAGVREAVYYDLCGNGGIPAGGVCDIDGDGIDDNQPYGPWGYFIDAAIGLKAYDLETSSGTNMAEALYGSAALGTDANRWSNSPGYLPWESFRDNESRYVQLNDFFPSGGYHASVVMADADAITDNVEQWIDGIAPNSPGRWFEVPLNSWKIKEATTAFYGEADFEGQDVPYTLNLGVRVVRTKVEVTSAVRDPQAVAENWTQATDDWNSQGVLLVWGYRTASSDYWDILPSLNFVLDTSDNSKVRFSAAKVIARPNLQSLGRGESFNYTRVNDPYTYFAFTGGTSGNPTLDPYRATQADVAYEWYFDELGLLSVGAFVKAVDSFIAQETRLEFGADEGPGGGRPGGVNRPQNGSGGSVKGMEFSVQQAFANSFGGSFNYTFSDSNIDSSSTLNPDLGLPGISEHAFNVMGFYENDFLSARLAYTWRDEFLSPQRSVFDVGGLENGASEFFRAYGQWDASIIYDFSDNFGLSLEAFNITGESQSSYLGYRNQPMTYTSQEPRIVAGVNYRL